MQSQKRKAIELEDHHETDRGNKYVYTSIQDEANVIQGNNYGQVNFIRQVKVDRGQRLLDALWYPEMFARLNEIKDIRQASFDWAFKDDRDVGFEIQSLNQWIRAGSGVYFVEGRAGSGKSTFMKFLFKQHQVRDMVQETSPSKALHLMFHAFWIVGNPLQSSLKGLLFSLLYQLLSEDTLLLEQAFEHQDLRRKRCGADWSVEELKSLLFTSLRKSQKLQYIFVDGLDELGQNDDVQDLLEVVDDLVSQRMCKICVSGRPEPRLISHFSGCARLKLHDLTHKDIAVYVSNEMKRRLQFDDSVLFDYLKQQGLLDRHQHRGGLLRDDRSSGASRGECIYRDDSHYDKDSYEYDESLVPSLLLQDTVKSYHDTIVSILSTICRKANGVFLWVVYVLRNVFEGFGVEDDLHALHKRIEELPCGMLQLYRHMFQRYKLKHSVHIAATASMLKLGQHFPMPLFQLVVAITPELRQHYAASVETRPANELDSLCSAFARSLNAKSAGLLEWQWSDQRRHCFDDFNCGTVASRPSKWYASWGCRSNTDISDSIWRRMKVQYIHRSVHEFLGTTAEGQEIIGSFERDQEWHTAVLQSSLACLVEDVVPINWFTISVIVMRTWKLGSEGLPLLRAVDQQCQKLLRSRGMELGRMKGDWLSYLLYLHLKLHGPYGPPSFRFMDYTGLLCRSSGQADCGKLLLSIRHFDPSPYYKGHLILTALQFEDTFDYLPIDFIQDMMTYEADMATLHTVSVIECPWILLRSPASQTVAVLLARMLQDPMRFQNQSEENISKLHGLLTRLQFMVPAEQRLSFFVTVNDDKLDYSALPPKRAVNMRKSRDSRGVIMTSRACDVLKYCLESLALHHGVETPANV